MHLGSIKATFEDAVGLPDVQSPLESRIARWAPVPLRLIVGYGFMEHGFAKLGRGPEAFADILHAIGVPGPHVMAWATILTEVIGGLAVILGAFVALVALPMAALLVVATFTVHLPYGFSSVKLLSVTAAGAQFGPPGYELNLLYLACLAALVLGGSGPLAIDGLVRRRRSLVPSGSEFGGPCERAMPAGSTTTYSTMAQGIGYGSSAPE
jgi:putative oxidoreductase